MVDLLSLLDNAELAADWQYSLLGHNYFPSIMRRIWSGTLLTRNSSVSRVLACVGWLQSVFSYWGLTGKCRSPTCWMNALLVLSAHGVRVFVSYSLTDILACTLRDASSIDLGPISVYPGRFLSLFFNLETLTRTPTN